MQLGEEEIRHCGVLRKYIELVVTAVDDLTHEIAPPLFIEDGNRSRFRYEQPNGITIQILLAVRIASGLSAAWRSLTYSYIIETGVLFRTIADFIGDTVFVEETFDREPNAARKLFLDNFFLKIDDPNKRHVGRAQKVQASEARFLNAHNPHRIGEIVRTIDQQYDAYIHGDYAPTMDLYHGRMLDAFALHGVSDARHIGGYRRELAKYTHGTVNMLCGLAHRLGRDDIAHAMREARRDLEKLPTYDE